MLTIEKIKEYLNKQQEYVDFYGDDLTSVCLDGIFNIQEFIDLILSQHRQELKEKIEKMRKEPVENFDNQDKFTEEELESVKSYGIAYNQALTDILNLI